MKLVINPYPDNVVPVDSANHNRVVVIGEHSVGVVIKSEQDGRPVFYIIWSNGNKSSMFKTLNQLFDSLSSTVKMYEL